MPASRTEPRLERLSPPPARTKAQGASLNASLSKAPTVPPFHLKSSKGCNFYYPGFTPIYVQRQSNPEAPNKRMPEKCQAVESGEPEDGEDCECPNNNAALLAVKSSGMEMLRTGWTSPQKERSERAKLRKTQQLH